MRAFIYIIALTLLTGCFSQSVWAPEAVIEKTQYRQPGPSTITLYTVKSEGSDSGAHTSLLINASQRVLWDPAGNFGHASIPERNDVFYGINPAVLDYYNGYHTIGAYYVTTMTVEVEPEVAEDLLRRVMAHGTVGYAQCANSTSALLAQTQGFESISQTWFPNNVMDQFAKLPNVTTKTFDNPTNAPAVLRQWPG